MYVRHIALALASGLALSMPVHLTPRFTLQTTGAVQLNAGGHDARYGVIGEEGSSTLTVSLGATGPASALQLRMPGAGLPAEGRYPIRSSWDKPATAPAFAAFFAAGSPERPLGWFHGESGTVTITRVADGRLSGSFEIRARGFLTADTSEQEHLVTVTGSFEAEGDSTVTTIAAAR
jgi:hypothetical protein